MPYFDYRLVTIKECLLLQFNASVSTVIHTRKGV